MPYVFNPFTGNFDFTTSASTGGTEGTRDALPLSGGNLTGLVTNTDGISASYIRTKQGIPNSADSSTNGYAFAGDGDTGLFSPVVGGGPGNGVVAIYTNNVEQVRFVNNNAGFGTETPNTKVSVVGSVSASDTVYDGVGNSNNWNSAYDTSTAYQNASSSFATNTFVNTNFFKVSGGTISGATRINNNLTVFGNLTATGTTTFANTVFTVTSALSVVHIGSGTALWVGNNGDGDIASFYDLDQNIEVLHVGGNSGSFPNVGVKTSSPGADFTVNGQISSNNIITVPNGNSNNWNNAYSNLVSNSAAYLSAVNLSFLSVSGNWNRAYSNLVSNSAAYLSAVDLSFLSVSGNWNSAYNSTTALNLSTSNWNNTYNTVQSNSATTWNYQGTDLKALSGNWQSTYGTVSSLSANWNSAYSNLVSNSAAYLSAVDLSFLSVSGNWNSAYNSVTSLSSNWILDGGNTKGSNILIGTNDAFNLNIETNNVTRLTVLSSGNVGIGTQLPNQNLAVVGNISASTSIITPTVSADVINGGLGETVFTDSSNFIGNGENTLTMSYLSGVYISQPRVNIESRLYMYSPNGTRYYLNVTNTGVLTATIG
jgi:hypothetical protein